MSRIHLSAPPAFGYVGPKVNADEAGRTLGKGHHTLRKIADNGLKVAGYIPLIGVVTGVVGIWRAIFSEYTPSSSKLSLAGHIFRGTVEIIGLGGVFFPVDVVTTVYRRFFKDQAPAQGPATNGGPTGLTGNPTKTVSGRVVWSNEVSKVDPEVPADPLSDSLDETSPLSADKGKFVPNKKTRVKSTDDSSENSPVQPDSKKIPLASQERTQLVNERPPPPNLELTLKVGCDKSFITTGIRFGAHFAEDIHDAVVNRYPTLEGQGLGVLCGSHTLDEQGKVDGEFPQICQETLLKILCYSATPAKNARNNVGRGCNE